MPSYLQYNTSALHYINFINAWRNNIKVFQKFDAGAVQLFFLLHALARLMSVDAPASEKHREG
jgi:hypothetical protein